MKNIVSKEDRQKGFSLVELIVVMVILSILAAVMVPSMVGWIDKAKENQILLEARNGYLAAQTLVQEEYIRGTDYRNIDELVITDDDINELARAEGEHTIEEVNENYIITGYTYKVTKNRTTYTARYDGDVWTITH